MCVDNVLLVFVLLFSSWVLFLSPGGDDRNDNWHWSIIKKTPVLLYTAAYRKITNETKWVLPVMARATRGRLLSFRRHYKRGNVFTAPISPFPPLTRQSPAETKRRRRINYTNAHHFASVSMYTVQYTVIRLIEIQGPFNEMLIFYFLLQWYHIIRCIYKVELIQ